MMSSNPTVSASSATPSTRHPNSPLIPYSRLLRSKVNRTPRRGLDWVGPRRRRRRRSQVRRLGGRSQGQARPRTCEVSGTWSRTYPTRTSQGEWWDRWGSGGIGGRVVGGGWSGVFEIVLRENEGERASGEWEKVERERIRRESMRFLVAGFHVLWFGGVWSSCS